MQPFIKEIAFTLTIFQSFNTKQNRFTTFGTMIKNGLLFSLTIIITTFCQAQIWQPAVQYVPSLRQIFHDNIDNSQRRILSKNTTNDSVYKACNNNDINLFTTYYLQSKIDYLQSFIESNTKIDEKDKYKYLRGLNELLTSYESAINLKNITAVELTTLINAFENALLLHIAGKSITPIIENNEPEIGALLLPNFAFDGNEGLDESKLIIISKVCKANPANTFKILNQYPNLPNADSLIINYAYINPEEVYNYAASNTAIGTRIKNINEPLVNLITEMANTNNGRFLFPFIDDILAKRVTKDEILKTIDDAEAYYKLLVKTIIHYEVDKQNNKKLLAMETIADKLKAKAVEVFITPINALHDEKDANIRFAKIKNLSPVELYFLTVMGEEEMYTSSFINGVYPKMIEGLGTVPTDSLLRQVHYGYYRKFIKMCAGFNMLENFLAKMDKPVAENLMKSFANNLQDYWSLEEAVDVADSYASITDTSIKKILKDEVQKNVTQQTALNNKKGKVIYGLLNQIFNSFDSTITTNKYNLPSVIDLSNKKLQSTNGKIYVQQFFYGDKDGKAVFDVFVNNFRNNGWRIINKPNWIEVSSNTTTPITIFANKPLNEEEGLDDAAQKQLYNYLDSLSIYPSIIIHRGHSYYVKTTIKQITSYANLVLLGSCGGYHSLSKVLEISPQAQIISSKQIGTGKINNALIEIIFEQLKQGKDLNWVQVWKKLETKFTTDKELKERFDDYIPPQKNLGAIFIMAYHKAMEEESGF